MFIKHIFLIYLLALTRIKSDDNVTESVTNNPSDEIEFTTVTNEELNRTINTGNDLWDNFFKECHSRNQISCIQKNVYSYLDSNLEFKGDYRVINGIVFKPNVVDYTKYSKEYNEVDNNDEDDYSGVEDARAIRTPPIEEVTNALYDKGIKFMMTHDLELQMPDLLFEGAKFKISPRAIEGNGALVHLELVPKEIVEEEEARGPAELPKIFKKKIRKYLL